MIKKEEFYILHAELCKAIFNPKRLAIIDALKNGRMNVSELSSALETSQSNISQHLGILKTRGLVKPVVEGNNTYYSISDAKILEAIGLVNQMIKERSKKENKIINEQVG